MAKRLKSISCLCKWQTDWQYYYEDKLYNIIYFILFLKALATFARGPGAKVVSEEGTNSKSSNISHNSPWITSVIWWGECVMGYRGGNTREWD